MGISGQYRMLLKLSANHSPPAVEFSRTSISFGLSESVLDVRTRIEYSGNVPRPADGYAGERTASRADIAGGRREDMADHLFAARHRAALEQSAHSARTPCDAYLL